MMKPSRVRLDLLRYGPMHSAVKRPWFPLVLQIVVLAGVVALVVVGFGTTWIWTGS